MSSYITLLKEKRNLLLEAFEDTNVDKTNPEACILALTKSREKIDAMSDLESAFQEHLPEGVEEERLLLDEILTLLLTVRGNIEEISKVLQNEKLLATESMQDLSLKKNVARSYVKTDQGPVFVDKDFT